MLAVVHLQGTSCLPAGRSPHKHMPMPGVHPSFERTLREKPRKAAQFRR